MADRRYKLIGQGLPGSANFTTGDLVDDNLIQWDATAGRWTSTTVADFAATLDHGALGGLADNDHPQYARIATDETITGTWTFSTLYADVIDNALAGVALRYAGSPHTTLGSNHLSLRSQTSDTPYIEFDNDAGTRLGFIQMRNDGSPTIDIKSEVHGGLIRFRGENTAGTSIRMLDLDPDGPTAEFGTDVNIQMSNTLGDRIALYSTLEGLGTYALGIEASTLYYRSGGIHRWYVTDLADGGTSSHMQMSNTELELQDIGLTVKKPSDFWSAGSGTYIDIAGVGHMGTDGSFGMDFVSNGYRNDVAGWTSMNVNSQAGGAKISLRPNGDILMYGSATVSGTQPDRWLFWDASGDRLYLDGTNFELNSKLAFRASDAWLRLNQDSDFTSGVYTPGILRADGGFVTDASGYSVDTSATLGIRSITGTYGTVETFGSGTGGWRGYSISGRVVFMHDDSNTWGIYNDVNNEWMIQGTLNGKVDLYHNGTATARTADYNATDKLSGMELRDYGGTYRPAGYLDCEKVDFTSNTTVSNDHWGKLLRHTSGTAHNLTFNSASTVPSNVMLTLVNGSGTSATGVVTLVEGTGVTIRLFNGSSVTEGNVAVANGGVATIFKLTDTVYMVWGGGLS